MWVVKVKGYEETPEEGFMRNMENYVINCAKRYYVDGYESDDIAQELRMHLWKKLHKYDPTKGKIETWGRLVLENKARDMYKKKMLEMGGEIPETVAEETHFSCSMNGITTHFFWNVISKSYNLIETNDSDINDEGTNGKEKENDRGGKIQE